MKIKENGVYSDEIDFLNEEITRSQGKNIIMIKGINPKYRNYKYLCTQHKTPQYIKQAIKNY